MITPTISLIGLSLAQITGEGLGALPAFLGRKVGEDYAKTISKSAIESVLRRAKDAEPAANHDLQRATRRSSLFATTVMVRHLRQFIAKSEPHSDWIDWCDRLTAWLKEEAHATRSDKYRIPPSPADERFADLIAHGEHPLETLGGELQRLVIAGVQDEIRQWHLREWFPGHADTPGPHAQFLHWLADGWPFVEEPKSLAQKFASVFTRRRGNGPDMHRRSQAAQPSATETGQTLHWFPLFAAFFTEEIKTDNRVHTIFDAKLLTEINDRLKQAPALDAGQLGGLLTGTLDEWGHEFCERLDELHRLVSTGQTEILDQLAKLDTVAARNAAMLTRIESKVDSVKDDTQAIRAAVGQSSIRADLRAKLTRAQELHARDDGKEAIALLEEVHHAARAHGLKTEQLEATLNLAFSTSQRHDFKAVERRLREAEKLARDVTDPWHQIQFYRLRARVFRHKKKYPALVEKALQKAIALSAKGDKQVEQVGLCARADYIHLLCEMKRAKDADEYVTRVRQVVEAPKEHHPVALLAELLEACIHWAIAKDDRE